MPQYFGVFLLLLISSVFAAQSIYEDPLYINMYGTTEDRSPRIWKYLKLGLGVIKFLKDTALYLNDAYSDTTPSSRDTYDFIIVGAGSAGCAIAARLSETKQVKVLLLEAGDVEHFANTIPLLANYVQHAPEINWGYRTKPSENYCRGMEDNSCAWPEGRAMGGSSMLNYMIATRGFPQDYDNWEEMGNPGWAYKDVLKYFKKLESINIEKLMNDTENHNTNGPQPISYAKFRSPLSKAFLNAGVELGYSVIEQNDRKDHVGFSYFHTTTKDGSRYSSNRAYLHPIKGRENLHVSRVSHVTRILIDPDTKRAYGVEFRKLGETHVVNATKEVILTAGGIGSPKLLMLSGVGPSDHLKDLNINVVKDAPVGDNLMDHVGYVALAFLVNQPVTITEENMFNFTKDYINDYLHNHDGPLANVGGSECIAFLDIENNIKDTNRYPDLEILFIPASLLSIPTIHTSFKMSGRIWNRWMLSSKNRDSYSSIPIVMRPKSRGKVRLNNTDPLTHPIIDPNYFDDPYDMKIIIKGIRESIRLSDTIAMQKFKSALYPVVIPGCEEYEMDSDDYWDCAVRTFTFTVYHYSGTCKMGAEADSSAVVNPRLKVIGVEGLRVADSSIMPQIVSGHLNIPVLMIAEKLSDMVKEDWGLTK